jgi:hypothetical protein
MVGTIPFNYTRSLWFICHKFFCESVKTVVVAFSFLIALIFTAQPYSMLVFAGNDDDDGNDKPSNALSSIELGV